MRIFTLLFALMITALPSWAATFAIDVKALKQTTFESFTEILYIPVWLSQKQTSLAYVTLAIDGAKTQAENFGTGMNLQVYGDGIGGPLKDGYEKSFVVVTFKPGETKKVVSVAIVNNGVMEIDRKVSFTLKDPSTGHRVVLNNVATIKIVDDTIPRVNGVRNIVDVVWPNKDFDTGADFDRGLKGARGDGVTDDTAAIQGVVDWLYAHGGGVCYFPGAHTAPMLAPEEVKPKL